MTKLQIQKISFDIWMNPYVSTRLILKGSPQNKIIQNYAQLSLKNLMLSKDLKMVIAYHKVVRFANPQIQEIMQDISKSVYDL